ncbi:MAG TPA: hypothetical protein VMA98_05775 [Candidatus Acidoferrales bacterium]|nr:hypothetical protein [Candidatus Acidoferrales bacterium]
MIALASARPADSAHHSFSLSQLRARATELFAVLAWAHVPAVAGIALFARTAWVGPTGILLCIAIAATVAAREMKDGPALRAIMALAVAAGPVMFGVAAWGSWSVDVSLYFFAIFAMLIGYADWRPIAMAVGVAAGYGVIASVSASDVLFPAEGMDRFVLQAIFLLAECYVLIAIANTLQTLFSGVDEFMDFTMKETSAALAGEIKEKSRLQEELARLKASAA